MRDKKDEMRDDMEELRDAFMQFATVLVKKVTQFVDEAIEQGDIGGAPGRGGRRGGRAGRTGSSGQRRKRRRKDSPNRKNQLLQMVRERPGLSLSEAGELANTKPVAFARAASLLVEAGQLKRDEEGRLFPA